MAPHRYVTDRRIEKAKFWISEGRRPLAEIAYLCGFSSQPSFTKWVRTTCRSHPAGIPSRLPLIKRPALTTRHDEVARDRRSPDRHRAGARNERR